MFDKNKIETLFKIKTGNNKNDFIELLKKHNAVVAGSFVLSQYTPSPSFKPYDIDIYVNERDFESFIVSLIEKGIFQTHVRLTSGLVTSCSYDQSFFKKNGIKFKISGFLNLKECFPTDIMIVRDYRNIKDVVTNFDLSICEIWYDGNEVKATHENHILKKEGMLRKEYHTSFFEGNKFIIKRIQKYKKRGFTIQLEKTDNYIISVEEKDKELKKENAEETLVKYVLEKLIDLYLKKVSFHGYENDWRNEYAKEVFKNQLDSKFKKCSELELDERRKCFSKQLYLFCNRFYNYDIIELYLNSRVFLGCNKSDVIRVVHELKNHMNYNKKNLETEYEENTEYDFANINQFEKAQQKIQKKIQNIDILLNFIKTLDLKIDNVEFLLKNIYFKYEIIKNNNYEMKPIVVSEDLSEINGFNIITLENSKVGEYLKENKTNIVLIDYNNDKINGDVCLMDRDSLETYILNVRDQWFYECREIRKLGTVVKSKPYIRLPTNKYNIYVYWYELFDMYFRNKKGQQVFLFKTMDEKINYSISHHNAFNENPDWVSANHCQDGTDFKVSKIYFMSKSKNKSTNSMNKSIINNLERSLLQHLNEKTMNRRNSKVKSLSSSKSSKSSKSKIKSI